MQEIVTSPARQSLPARVAGDQANVGELERMVSTAAGTALLVYGLGHVPVGLPAALAGGYLLYRGIGGHCPLYASLNMSTAEGGLARPSHIEHTITINAEPAELYKLWRDFRNLPRFMDHLQEVRVLDDRRSHWVVKAPAGQTVAWDAEILLERENELISWRSLPDAQIANAGSVRFSRAPSGRGTEVRVVLEYVPPGGALGRIAARMFGEEPEQQVIDDLRRLKMIVETGEIATNAMRPAQHDKEQR